jgi:RNA polymerase sigma-70 factor (ECF subfamily)
MEFLRLAEGVKGPLTAYLRGLLRNPSDLPDALQSTLLTAFRKFGDFHTGTDFRAWVFRIATLTAFDMLRRQTPIVAPADVPAEVELEREYAYEEILNDPERVLQSFDDDVRRALLALTEQERAALLLVSVTGCRAREVAEILDMPLGSVMGYVGRARGKLRERLAEFARQQRIAGRRP